MKSLGWVALLLTMAVGLVVRAADPARVVAWKLDRLAEVGGQPTELIGSPRLIPATAGGGVEFDGESAIFVDVNPLAGLSEFTVEVVFRPAARGGKEQRFVHIQEAGSENRLLFELRLTDDNRWFLDSFIKSGEGNYTLFAERLPHSIGPWYHAAVVMDGKTMRHFVNGNEELSTPIKFAPQRQGTTSLGVRQNRVSWYSGAIREVRVTPRAIPVAEFLMP